MSEHLGVLWQLMRGQRLRYAGALAALFVSITIGYLVPLVCQITLDGAILGKPVEVPRFAAAFFDALGGAAALGRHLWLAFALLAGLTALSGVFMYLRGRWGAVAAESIARGLRDQLYDHLQHLPCRYHDQAKPGDLIQRCTSDVETVRNFLSMQVLEVGRAVLMLVLVIPMMLWLDWRMTLVSMTLVPVIVAFTFFFHLKVRAAFKLADEAEGEMTARLQENLTGIRVVRAFARQDFEIAKFAERNALYRDRTYRLIRILARFWSGSDLMCMTQNALVLFCGALWVSRGELTIGTLYAFIAYVNMFLWPVRMMGRVLADLGKTQVSLGRLGEILQHPVEADPRGAAPGAKGSAGILPASGAGETPALQAARGELLIEGLRFAHDGASPVLHDLTLRVPSGETLALLGPSGSGKSTLVHLLLRFYDYEHGSVRLDGRELRELPRKAVRARIGAVLQEPFLYARNLRENIRLGQAQAADGEIETAAQEACIHEAIVGFEKGYETLVGERGVMLSGGQRQRVALARALVRNPHLLILDDALSAVDTETEAMILRMLDKRRGRRTTLLIAHRLSTLRQADRIVVLEKGRLTQIGTHAELIRQDGLYRRLWLIQSALEEDLGRELAGANARIEGRGLRE